MDSRSSIRNSVNEVRAAKSLYSQLSSPTVNANTVSQTIKQSPGILTSPAFMSALCPHQSNSSGRHVVDYQHTNQILRSLGSLQKAGIISSKELSSVMNARFPQTGETVITQSIKDGFHRMRPATPEAPRPAPAQLTPQREAIRLAISMGADTAQPNDMDQTPSQLFDASNLYTDMPQEYQSVTGNSTLPQPHEPQEDEMTRGFNPQEANLLAVEAADNDNVEELPDGTLGASGAVTVNDDEANDVEDYDVNTDYDVNPEEEEENENPEDWLHLQDPTKTKKDKKYAKINGTFDDPDYGDAENEPIKIEQGDMIEFLMKDVVLASAGWAGGKVSGVIGLYSYRTLSAIHHKTTAKAGKWVAKGWDSYWKERHEKRLKRLEDAEKNKIPQEDCTPNENDDRTTAFAKETYALYNKYAVNQDALTKYENIKMLVDFAINHPMKDLNKLKPAENRPPEYIAMAKALRRNIDNNPNFDRERDRETLLNMVAENAQETILYTKFATAYASARMLHEKEKNPDKFADMETNAVFKIFHSEARKLYLSELRKINHDQRNIMEGNTSAERESKFTDASDLLKLANNAFTTAKENVKKGKYQEKGKEPINPDIEKLNNILNGVHESDLHASDQELMSQALSGEGKKRDYQAEHEDITAEVEALGRDKENLGAEREKVKQVKKQTRPSENNAPVIGERQPAKPVSQTIPNMGTKGGRG